MADPTPLDPFTAAYQAIWAALRANSAFTGPNAIVKPGNQIDFSDGTRQVIKPVVQIGDLPEVTLLQTTCTLSPYGSNSKIASATQVYPLVDVTGSLQVASANQVKWAVLGALYHTNLEDQQFNGKPYIGRWHITGGSDGAGGISLPGTDAARGVARLSTILNISVELFVAKSDLPA